MEINFKDINPVQLNYNSVPRDFLNKWKFIKQEVDSPLQFILLIPAPVVVVQKKDVSIRMCCASQKLNAKNNTG